MSVVTRIELLSYAGEAREILRIERFIQATIVLALDEPVIIETIRLRRQHKRKLPDTIIAATALVHQLTALTRNIADFRTIPGLTVVNLHEPASLPAL